MEIEVKKIEFTAENLYVKTNEWDEDLFEDRPGGTVELAYHKHLKDRIYFDSTHTVTFNELPKEIQEKAMELHNAIQQYFNE